MSDETRQTDLITGGMGWTSDNPHLRDHFEPVGDELDQADLPVTFGRIPDDLKGAYMRNGPNPLFKPLSYNFPMDGDGMIHAVYFDEGRARYKNRFVRTRGLAVERRAGRAVYGGLLSPVPVDPALVGEDGEPGLFKNGAFINILSHAGQLLALGEAAAAYEMTTELDTIGEWRPGTDAPLILGAHNRHHKATKDLYALDYLVEEPLIHVHQIDKVGKLARSFSVSLAAPSMIHDFVLTGRYMVLLVGPAVFDVEAAERGEPLLQWRREMGTRIGVIPLDGAAPVWIEAEPFFVFHFANGFEAGGDIIIDYVRHDRLPIGPASGDHQPPRLHRLVIDVAARRARDEMMADFPTELPRIDDRFEALPSRFIFTPVRTASLTLVNAPGGTFNAVARFDTKTGQVTRHDFGNRASGEPVFIPRPGAVDEAAGYISVFVYDPVSRSSDLVLLDAQDIAREPVAVIKLPQRVPMGLHGNWIRA